MVLSSLDIKDAFYSVSTHLSASHIPGKHNIYADIASRKFQDEWMLSKELLNVFGLPEIILFASRTNKQLNRYVSWLPDPGSSHIGGMSISWQHLYVYALLLFGMIWPVINKI